MSNANKITRYLTTIDSTPSYAINILVVKPMTVATTFFFFLHTSTIFLFQNNFGCASSKRMRSQALS